VLPAAEPSDSSRFAALDDPAVRAPFLEFDDGQQARALFSIPTLHCASCVRAVESVGRMHPGIVRADADLLRRTVRVTFRSDQAPLSAIAESLAAVGYPPALEAERTPSRMPPARRLLYLKLGVAGFAFGNIMLFSLPRYLNGGPLEGGFQRLFDTLNLALSIPVLLFSASGYFQSAWHAARRRRMSLDVPIAIGLVALFGRSVSDIALGRSEGFFDSFTGLVFFLLVGQLFRQKAFDRIAFDRTFRSFFPLSVRVEPLLGGPPSVVPLDRVGPGDHIVVRRQEVIPADARLLDESGAIDYAFLTGEERPVPVSRGETVRAGGRAASGTLRLEVIADVSSSYLAGLWNNPLFAKPKRDWLTDVSARFGAWFTVGAIALAAVGALLWWPDADRSIEVATAVLIIACPCALTLAAPITLGTAMGMLGRTGLYLKNAAVALNLSRIDTIVFDKTGTLTGAETTLRAEPDGLTPDEWRLAQRLSTASAHPVSRAVAAAGSAHVAATAEAGDRTAAPPATAQETAGGGLRGQVDGRDVVIGSSAFVATTLGLPPMDDDRTAVAIDGTLRGWVRVSAESRPGIEHAVRRLAEEHDVRLLSGDHERHGRHWRDLFGPRMWFRQCPEDKLAMVSALQAEGRHVLMIGDGLNDAGALGAADVGVAVSDDTACVVPACDVVVRGDQLARLPRFLAYARRARQIVVLCFVVSIVYNLIGLSFALAGWLTPLAAAILMPVSSLTVIGLSVGLTRWAAPEVTS
jgi:Cu+-exporting ATPase